MTLLQNIEHTGPRDASCTDCGTPFGSQYHEVSGRLVCALCRVVADVAYLRDTQPRRLLIALAYGLAAALLGGLLYWGIVRITGLELALVAIVVGWMVGKAVMLGSRSRGGRRYQILAVALTYLSIAVSFGALVVCEAKDVTPALIRGTTVEAVALQDVIGTLATVVGFVLVSPLLAGIANTVAWLIIGLALGVAWRQTRMVPFSSRGPFPVDSTTDDAAGAP